MRLLQRWLNRPPREDAESITDRNGTKYWIRCVIDCESSPEFAVFYRGRLVGRIISERNEPDTLTLADIVIHRKKHLHCGLGKAMLAYYVDYAKKLDVSYIWGFITPSEDSPLEYLIEWYKRQGFQVYEVGGGKYHIKMQLRISVDE